MRNKLRLRRVDLGGRGSIKDGAANMDRPSVVVDSASCALGGGSHEQLSPLSRRDDRRLPESAMVD